MAANFVNYIIMIVGIVTILAAVILIMVEKLKGEDLYFNIDVKEQQLKKVVEDAEEIISELNYISDVVVQEIEDKMKSLQEVQINPRNVPDVYNAKPIIAAVPITLKNKPSIEKNSIEKQNSMKLSPKQQSVYDYANQGLSVVDIAKKMNMGQGEVKLILSLKNEVFSNE